MGQSLTSDLATHFENFKDDFVKETFLIKELVGLCYSDFLGMVKELNTICCGTVDCNGRTLLFVIKGGTDSTLLWRQTVQIACVRVIKENKKVEDYKLLNLRQFLQAYKTVLYHINCMSSTDTSSELSASADCASKTLKRNPISTSMILNEIGTSDSATELEECIICMERKPEVSLPCAHSYCLFCIEQWQVSSKTCPVCRESIENSNDTWVIPDIPESSEVNAELLKTLEVLTSRDPNE